MPTYEYKCSACKHAFEVYQSIKDSPKRKCPSCAKNALERLIGTGGAIIFKGSGFYQTDYRSESYRKAAEADKASPAPSGAGESSSGNAGSESKPAESKPSEVKAEKSQEHKSAKAKPESKAKDARKAKSKA